MQNAELYSANHMLQRRDTEQLLEDFAQHFKWDLKSRVLDMGCGPGDTTASLLLPWLPSHSQLVGIDISPEMVDYAQKFHSSSRLQFQKFDIQSTDATEICALGKFDKIFSFFTFHWIQNQRQAFQNVYDLLKSGGEILFLFITNCSIFTLYERLARNPRWTNYMQDVVAFLGPYQHSLDPCAEIEQLLSNLGFQKVQCSIQKKVYAFHSFPALLKAVEALNPFLRRIPNEIQSAYLKDCEIEILKLDKEINIQGTKLSWRYETITILAQKL